MPSPRRGLSEAGVRQFVEDRCFGVGEGRVGAELEWFVTGGVTHEAVVNAVGTLPLPCASRITFEPGGQVELSSTVGSLAEVWHALDTDHAELTRRLATIGAGLLAVGVHPDAEPVRVRRDARYDAMEAYWAAGGEHDPGAGLAMMCTTAALQVNLDAATRCSTRDDRWRLAHAISPVLAAAFANSPVARGAVTGWRSTRLGIWEGLDRTRTSPALRSGHTADDWTAYLLAANTMMIRTGDRLVPLERPLPFGAWLAEGHELGWPDLDDLTYHLSTVFPPVRAKGWLELRSVDALDEQWWAVPMAVTAALLDDPEAADGARRATGRALWCWCEAPRWSLSYAPLAEAATRCFDLARDALGRMGAPSALIDVVAGYQEQFVDRGLCPADRVTASVGAP